MVQMLLKLLNSNIGKYLIVLLVSLCTATGVVGITYYKAYKTGYAEAEEKHALQQYELLRAHSAMENNLQLLAINMANKDSEIAKLLDKRVNLLISKVDKIKLTTPDCKPTEDFKKVWNEANKDTSTITSTK